MSRLIEDLVIRRTAQTLLLAFAASLCAVCAAFDYIIVLDYLGRTSVDDQAIYAFMRGLRVPFQTDFAAFIVAATGAFPVVLSSVCFQINDNLTPPGVTDRLNAVGDGFFLLLTVGLLACAGAIILFSLIPPESVVQLTSGKETDFPAVKSLFTGILSFESIYIVQIVGLKPK